MADFDVELLTGDFVVAQPSSIWTDPALDEDPTRLNPRGHVQHRHMKLRISATGSMDVLMRAIVAGVTAPADGALGGRLFGWSVGIWPAGAPIPMITSPDGGKTSQARFTLQGRFPGHYVIVAARPNGGHIGYPLDVEVIP